MGLSGHLVEDDWTCLYIDEAGTVRNTRQPSHALVPYSRTGDFSRAAERRARVKATHDAVHAMYGQENAAVRRRVARRARRGTRGEGDTARAMARMPEQGAVVVDLVDNEQPHLDLEAIREAMHEAQRQRRGSRGSRRREHDQRGGASRKGAHAAMRRRGCLMQPRPGF